MKRKLEKEISWLRTFTITTAITWTLVLAIFLGWNIIRSKKDALHLAQHAARAYFNKDQAFRLWATKHGGVYVEETEATPANPYLSHVLDRDIVTPSGKKLTLMNPAYMLRQVMTDYSNLFGVRGKNTSLKPMNPVNKPDPWEAKALHAFENGADEIFEITEMDGEDYLRLMRPMITTKGCLKCHGFQGYKVGDVRGGVGVSVPLAVYKGLYTEHRQTVVLYHFLTWAMGLGVLFFLATRGRSLLISRDQISSDRESINEQLRLILDSLKEGVLGLDKKGNATFINPAATAMVQYKPEEIIGKSVHSLIHHTKNDGATLSIEECPHHQALSSGTVHFTPYDTLWRKDRTNLTAESTTSPIQKDGENLGAVITFRDASLEIEKQNLERQLRQAQKVEAIGTLAGGIAHDFNNILTAILGYAQVVQESLPKESDAWQCQHEVLRAGKRAKELVRQILTFSRKTEQDMQPLQIQLIVKEAIKLLRASIPSTIMIQESINPECGAVLADPTQVHQVMMNLCTNAFYAMRETGGVLKVSVDMVQLPQEKLSNNITLTAGQYLRMAISDTGCGITKENCEKIFEPYFTTKPKGEGTGLGLSVVHGIVKNHQGDITVYSEIHKGTTFQVYLPLMATGQAEEQKELAEQVIPGGNERILVVDDEPQLAILINKLLTTLGYEVKSLTSSVDALEILRKKSGSFDLLITDLTMPYLTGKQLAKHLRVSGIEIPIILCTGFSNEINNEHGEQQEINGYLLKPIIKRDLALAVRKTLDTCRTENPTIL